MLTKIRWRIYDLLFHSDNPLTASEISERLQISIRTISTRMTEMRNMDAVLECPEKECTVTRKKVISYDVTDKIPTPIEKPKPRYFWIAFSNGIPVAVREHPGKPDGYAGADLLKVRTCKQ